MPRNEEAPNSMHLQFEAVDIHDDNDPLNQRSEIRAEIDYWAGMRRGNFLRQMFVYQDMVNRIYVSERPVFPDTQDQLIHGNYVFFEGIDANLEIIRKQSLLELLDNFHWGCIPEDSVGKTLGRIEFKKRGGIKAITEENRDIYSVDPHAWDFAFESTKYFYADTLKPQYREREEIETHKPFEPGLHPNAIDAYYSVNDQVKRMINSESFIKMREEKRYA